MKRSVLNQIVLVFLILGILIEGFASWKLINYGYYVEIYIPGCLIGVIILLLLLSKIKTYKPFNIGILALMLSLIFFLVSISSLNEYFANKRKDKYFSEYVNMDCQELRLQFDKDLRNDELKYFRGGGVVGTGDLGENLAKYDIVHIELGCLVFENLSCYSDLVQEHLKKSRNIDVDKLF